MICCCEAAKQMEKVDKLVDAYKTIAKVFVDRPFEEYVTATNESRGAMLKQVCKSVLEGEIDTEVLLCFAGKLMDATEEVYQGSEPEVDSDRCPQELDSVLMDMEDEYEQFAEDFSRHEKAVEQAYELMRTERITKGSAEMVYRRAHSMLDKAYCSGLISGDAKAERVLALHVATKEVCK